MPIIHMTDNCKFNRETQSYVINDEFPENSYCPVFGYDYNHFTEADDLETRKRKALVLYTTHHGLCLYESERNGYDDSDFYMAVWNPETKESESIQFASTRGWSYPCYGSRADATPEVQAAYNEYLSAIERRNRILARWALRKSIKAERTKAGLTRAEHVRLTATYSFESFRACIWLLSTKHRNDFKKNLEKKLREWLADPAPKYNTPFSRKQLDCII